MTSPTPNRARLTPGYLHSMSFRLARLGCRGLDEDDVRDFCARVEDELARLREERASLHGEVRRLRVFRAARRPPFSFRVFRGAPARAEAVQMLGNVYVT